MAGRVEAVERALDARERHGAGAVHQRLAHGQHRRHRRRGCLLRPEVAPHDPAHLAAVQLLGERRCRWHRREREEAVQVAIRRGQELAIGAQHLVGLLDRPERRPRHHGAHRVQPEHERRDDAEVAAAAADRPEQVGVLGRARVRARSVRQDDLGLEHVVDREPVPAAQIADPAAEREAADAGRADDAARRRHADRVGGRVNLPPGRPALDPNGAGVGVDLDAAHRPEVDHDAVVAAAEAAAVVSAAADGEQRVMPARKPDHRRHVVGGRAAGDHRRALVDHRVVQRASVVVARVGRADQLAGEARQLALARRLQVMLLLPRCFLLEGFARTEADRTAACARAHDAD